MNYKILYRGNGFTSHHDVTINNYADYETFDDIPSFDSSDNKPLTAGIIQRAEADDLTVVETNTKQILHGTAPDMGEFAVTLVTPDGIADRTAMENPNNVTVKKLVNAFVIDFDIPITDDLSHVEVYMDHQDNELNLDRGNAELIYEGPSDNLVWPVPVHQFDQYHKFWVYSIPELKKHQNM